MASSPSHRTTMSVSNNLIPPPATPSNKQQRRMTSPSLPPPAPLNLPEPTNGDRRDLRPPSPLRNAVTLDSETGELSEDGSTHWGDEDDDDRSWGHRSHSPTPSMAKIAANFAQKVGSLVSNISPRPPGGMLSDEELEAQAEMEREGSRREAERILIREAEERQLVEERVLALLEKSRGSPQSMAPPPRAQTLPNPPSPSSSQRESGGWLNAVKNKLTPTKEPLTPAQQVILETKAKDKSKKKSKEKEWPHSPNGKFTDPAYLNLSSAAVTPPRLPMPMSASPSSPTPAPRPLSQAQPPDFSPSFMRPADSPSREAPPLYAQFNSQGVLDMPATLLTVARRFEKLERWTVGHVRALEERMSDVERWLVDKEKDREQEKEAVSAGNEVASINDTLQSPAKDSRGLGEVRDELAELQGRVSELGREMAKFATAASNLSSGPVRSVPPATAVSPTTTSTIAARSLPVVPLSTPRASTPAAQQAPTQTRVQASSSPPLTSAITTASTRTRLPYPTGDYTSPPNSIMPTQEPLSPAGSPPASFTQVTRPRPVSIAGLPSSVASFSLPPSASAPAGLPRPSSPAAKNTLPAPAAERRPLSTSPTPRKRYTVALGGPLVPPPADGLVSSPDEADTPSDSTFSVHSREDTIGKSVARLSASASPTEQGARPRASPTTPRTRAQSSYGPPRGYTALSASPSSSPAPITPLKPRLRSRSTDRFALALDFDVGAPGSGSGRFVDPLVLRKQEKEKDAPPRTPKVTQTRGKVPIGELVAFFDGDKP